MKITIIECMESNPYALFLEISMLQLAEQICQKMKRKNTKVVAEIDFIRTYDYNLKIEI